MNDLKSLKAAPIISVSDEVNFPIRLYVAGVYCMWWKAIDIFPLEIAIELAAGTRGSYVTNLRAKVVDSKKAIPLYVGKGDVKSRTRSHIKQSSGDGRNPYWWLKAIFPNQNIDDLIHRNIGFSYVLEENLLNQVYIENLAIGVFRPPFNFRYAC